EDAGAALVPVRADPPRAQPLQPQGRPEAGRDRVRARDEGAFRASERPGGARGSEPRAPGCARQRALGVLRRDQAGRGRGRHRRRAGREVRAREAAQHVVPSRDAGARRRPRPPGEGTMSLQARLAALEETEAPQASVTELPMAARESIHEEPPRAVLEDPYAELKARVHRACIARLGPQLFAGVTTEEF